MKKSFPYIIIAILLVILWFKSCSSQEKLDNSNNHQIKIREVKGSFDTKSNIAHKVIDTVYINQKVSKSTGLNNDKLLSDIEKLYKENEALKRAYIDADSLKRELMYLKSIQLSEFYQDFDNDTINLLVKGIVQGEIKTLQPFYTIKSYNIPIKQKEVKFRVLAGFSVGNNINFNDPLFTANIGFQNKKGNIIIGGFDTQKRITIAYYKTLFQIKK